METFLQAETITAYALGQRRGFILGVACGVALVLYTNRYKPVRRVHRINIPSGQTQYQTPRSF